MSVKQRLKKKGTLKIPKFNLEHQTQYLNSLASLLKIPYEIFLSQVLADFMLTMEVAAGEAHDYDTAYLAFAKSLIARCKEVKNVR